MLIEYKGHKIFAFSDTHGIAAFWQRESFSLQHKKENMSKELHLFHYYAATLFFTSSLSKQEKETIDYIWFPMDFADRYLPLNNTREEVIKAVFSRPLIELNNQYKHRPQDFHSRSIPYFSRCRTYLDFILELVSLDFSQYDKIYYWLEEESRSYLPLCYLCTFMQNENFYMVPVKRFHPEKENATFCEVSQVDFQEKWRFVKEQAVLIKKPLKKELSQNWKRLHKSIGSFRVMVNGCIETKSDDFIDKYIKEAVRKAGGSGNKWFDVLYLAADNQPYIELKGMSGWGYISERLGFLCAQREVHVSFPETEETRNLIE